ncbi:PP2C family serine/threonine-protein phosphatase [Pseudoxanthomonas sp.]|uniref:PP2C family protein-serine/threonine phosphatase n=1 Tax=Pseudoxanthomonas sp. TaxID=1871049 RepID=UPI002623F894|nr:PP2C family serine/threonine-protein phosphatase [Pseudoxanthomonas sp.]WDS37801.1 MAG: serine/threonine-protein phosphatase [Pseudoxanthomonas sp.]
MSHHCRSAGQSETGKVRRHNEDAILVREDAGLWVVADGLGGHAAGDLASGMIVDRLAALPRRGQLSDFIDAIEDALVQINAELLQIARHRQVDIIGSTVVVLVWDRDVMACGWAGDSRAYGSAGGPLRQITRDHVTGARDDQTQFSGTPEQGPPGALTRAVGAQEALYVDWVLVPADPGARYLLCSDGINKEIDDEELAFEFGRIRDPAAAVDRLFQLALGRKGRDNVSAVVVSVED